MAKFQAITAILQVNAFNFQKKWALKWQTIPYAKLSSRYSSNIKVGSGKKQRWNRALKRGPKIAQSLISGLIDPRKIASWPLHQIASYYTSSAKVKRPSPKSASENFLSIVQNWDLAVRRRSPLTRLRAELGAGSSENRLIRQSSACI